MGLEGFYKSASYQPNQNSKPHANTLVSQSSIFIHTSAVTMKICGNARRLPVSADMKQRIYREYTEIKQQVSKISSISLCLYEEEG